MHGNHDGKSRGSRANALKHGMAAKQLLPPALKEDRVEAFRQRFSDEFRPKSAVEDVLVSELARHAAMMEFGEHTERAVLRHGASELANLLGGKESDDESDVDAVLSAAIATDTLERFCRYRRMHERGFFGALDKLREIRHFDASRSKDKPPVFQFATESACARWLRERLLRPEWCCTSCGVSEGTWLEHRQRLQCNGCKRQHGIRSGTVMARSHLPLVKWFRAIEIVLGAATVSPAVLGQRIAVARSKTVQSMIGRIREAVAGDNASERLAGLDNCFGR